MKCSENDCAGFHTLTAVSTTGCNVVVIYVKYMLIHKYRCSEDSPHTYSPHTYSPQRIRHSEHTPQRTITTYVFTTANNHHIRIHHILYYTFENISFADKFLFMIYLTNRIIMKSLNWKL